MTGLELLVIPLVALLIPITLLLGALIFDAMFMTWLAYTWFARSNPHPWHLTQRSSLTDRPTSRG